MYRFVVERTVSAVATLCLLVGLLFAVFRFVPGSPFDSEIAMPQEVRAALERDFHLDEPVQKQFFRYIENLAHGELGPSIRSLGTRSVREVIEANLPVSAALGFSAFLIAIILGVVLGCTSVVVRYGFAEKFIVNFSAVGVAMPNYLFAMFLIYLFSIRLRVLPVALYEGPHSLVLPCLALSLRPLSIIARVTRASLLDVVESDYIRTAKAKGLGTVLITFKHALRNAIIPVVTIAGQIFASLISGSFLIEMMFALPGLGRQFVASVLDRDYPLLIGLSLFYGVVVICVNFISDIAYAIVDPRMRKSVVGDT